ncbi:DUF3152 domain-containing protein [Gordonia alkaliphila]|uniref:DUF3152 domain-containing protein n=1 Tax=Gordonia alkaliphila TaxID=1053547 RepID=UPI001FF52BC9|nr:DUF3152 domain-containing protein [Gordonia alkaliphila]MCK0438276.1 DUF3152 domain-containing protein [Gordonia alkaliphila]
MTATPPPGPTRPRRPRPDQPLRARWDPIGERDEDSEERKRGAVSGFLHAYGWRAYAIGVLAVLTVVLLVVTITDDGSGDAQVAAPIDPKARNVDVAQETTAIGAPTADIAAAALPAGALPAGGAFTVKGEQVFSVVPGTTDKLGHGNEVYTYTVEVEDGLNPQNFGGDKSFAKLVDATLANPKSWIGGGKVAFRRIDKGEPDLRISLTSTATSRDLCGYQIKLETSCFYPPEGRVVLNEARWVRGASAFGGDDLAYRQYLINHEVGHGIGYEHHLPCEQNGGLAPIMMQQTFGTSNSEIMALDPEMKANRTYTCRASAWPYPDK